MAMSQAASAAKSANGVGNVVEESPYGGGVELVSPLGQPIDLSGPVVGGDPVWQEECGVLDVQHASESLDDFKRRGGLTPLNFAEVFVADFSCPSELLLRQATGLP